MQKSELLRKIKGMAVNDRQQKQIKRFSEQNAGGEY